MCLDADDYCPYENPKSEFIMELMTKELEAAFAAQGYTDEMEPEDIKVIAKYFCPWGAASWFAVEYYPDGRIFFGYVNLWDDQNAELGDFPLDELEKITGPGGLKIERDLYFGEHTLKEVMDTKGHL
jgi:hypothetical protein